MKFVLQTLGWMLAMFLASLIGSSLGGTVPPDWFIIRAVTYVAGASFAIGHAVGTNDS